MVFLKYLPDLKLPFSVGFGGLLKFLYDFQHLLFGEGGAGEWGVPDETAAVDGVGDDAEAGHFSEIESFKIFREIFGRFCGVHGLSFRDGGMMAGFRRKQAAWQGFMR